MAIICVRFIIKGFLLQLAGVPFPRIPSFRRDAMRVFNQSLVPMRKVQTIGQGRKKRSIRNVSHPTMKRYSMLKPNYSMKEIESRTQDTTKWIVPSPSVVSKVRGYLHREKLPAGSAFIPTEAANGIWLSPSTSPYSVNEPERISSRRSLVSYQHVELSLFL